jgi:hypothetical protein
MKGDTVTITPIIIDTWSGITHGKALFATLAEAEVYSAQQIAQYGNRDCGWYWSCGQIEQSGDGRYWVVTP